MVNTLNLRFAEKGPKADGQGQHDAYMDGYEDGGGGDFDGGDMGGDF